MGELENVLNNIDVRSDTELDYKKISELQINTEYNIHLQK